MSFAQRGKADTDLLLANTAAYSVTIETWKAVPLIAKDTQPHSKSSKSSAKKKEPAEKRKSHF